MANAEAWLTLLLALGALCAAILYTSPVCKPGDLECLSRDPALVQQLYNLSDEKRPGCPGSECGGCDWQDPVPGELSAPLNRNFRSLHEALGECDADPACAAVSSVGKHMRAKFELHGDTIVDETHSGGFVFLRGCGRPSPTEAPPLLPEPALPEQLFPREHSEPTILLSVASFRDPLCAPTIADAMRRAKHPERVFAAVVDQRLPFDSHCAPHSDDTCSRDSDAHPLCPYRTQIRAHEVDARLARGPVWARHRADLLYRGERFLLQIDAHMTFVQDWDVRIVSQWSALNDDKAILTAYPSTALGAVDDISGRSLARSTPVMCRARLMWDAELPRFEQSLELRNGDDRLPARHPYFAAGLAFSRGHKAVAVTHDCCANWLFMGEEVAMAARLHTHGYSFYSFSESLVFHFYPEDRPKHTAPLFWGNTFPERASQAAWARVRRLLRLQGEGADETRLEEFGLGNEQTLESYWDLIGVELDEVQQRIVGVVEDQCHEIIDGSLFRHELQESDEASVATAELEQCSESAQLEQPNEPAELQETDESAELKQFSESAELQETDQPAESRQRDEDEEAAAELEFDAAEEEPGHADAALGIEVEEELTGREQDAAARDAPADPLVNHDESPLEQLDGDDGDDAEHVVESAFGIADDGKDEASLAEHHPVDLENDDKAMNGDRSRGNDGAAGDDAKPVLDVQDELGATVQDNGTEGLETIDLVVDEREKLGVVLQENGTGGVESNEQAQDRDADTLEEARGDDAAGGRDAADGAADLREESLASASNAAELDTMPSAVGAEQSKEDPDHTPDVPALENEVLVNLAVPDESESAAASADNKSDATNHDFVAAAGSGDNESAAAEGDASGEGGSASVPADLEADELQSALLDHVGEMDGGEQADVGAEAAKEVGDVGFEWEDDEAEDDVGFDWDETADAYEDIDL